MTGKRVTRRYTLEDRELALRTLAMHAGRYEQTADALQDHIPGLTKQTLWEWANNQQPDRYREICTEVHQQITEGVAAKAEQIMVEGAETALDLIAHLQATKDELSANEAAGAVRNIATVMALMNDKVAGPIRGRPNHIVQDRSGTEILRALQQLDPRLVVDSTAQEFDDPTPELPS